MITTIKIGIHKTNCVRPIMAFTAKIFADMVKTRRIKNKIEMQITKTNKEIKAKVIRNRAYSKIDRRKKKILEYTEIWKNS